MNNIIEVILPLFYFIIIIFYFYLDHELTLLTHDLDDLSSSLHIEARIKISWVELSQFAHFETPTENATAERLYDVGYKAKKVMGSYKNQISQN